jgi:hypothetical protein
MKTLLRSLLFLCAIAVFAPLSASADCVYLDHSSTTVRNPDGTETTTEIVTWRCGSSTYLVITVTVTSGSGSSWGQGTYRQEPGGGLTPIGFGSGSGTANPWQRPMDAELDHPDCMGCGEYPE